MSSVLTVHSREKSGTVASRAVRRGHLVPAIMYGEKAPPVMLSVEPIALEKQLDTGLFFSRLVTLKGDTVSEEKVLPRAAQFHPVTDKVMHVDFMRVQDDTIIAVNVPVRFLNRGESLGLKVGGVLNVVRPEIRLYCPAGQIPEALDVDLAGSRIGKSFHISAVELPDNARTVIADRDFTIATLSAPKGMEVASEDQEETEE
ncbi:MAG: 50S ribosomal protein L25/general stress protein Ctc [Alphaproteobacteria bacterium]|nr:50S ribosomal protein L25/general stress protein Ctc [Alphaproteobacteria bacterium]